MMLNSDCKLLDDLYLSISPTHPKRIRAWVMQTLYRDRTQLQVNHRYHPPRLKAIVASGKRNLERTLETRRETKKIDT